MEDLQQLLTDKTKIVALPHVSNLLGEVLDIAAVVRAVRDGPAGQLHLLHDTRLQSNSLTHKTSPSKDLT